MPDHDGFDERRLDGCESGAGDSAGGGGARRSPEWHREGGSGER